MQRLQGRKILAVTFSESKNVLSVVLGAGVVKTGESRTVTIIQKLIL